MSTNNDRRLGDRILHALELAVEQEELEIAESLARALELTLTRFGGPNRIDKRAAPEGLDETYARLEALRRSRQPA